MPLFDSGWMGEMRTSTDSRTRAQRYADSRWWQDRVKTVGYAIHRPEFDRIDRMLYSVEILNTNGTKTTRWLGVVTDVDGSGYIYDSSGIYRPRAESFARLER